MRGLAIRRYAIVGLAGILTLTLLVVAVWLAVAGPVTVYRVLRYGDTDIDDFSHYPGRTLHPSESPVRLNRPDGHWDLSSPVLSDQGLSGDLTTMLEANDTIAFLVLQGDAILNERYFQGHTASSRSQLFSVTKSIVSVLIGMAIADGYIEGVDQPVTDLVPELRARGFEDVTIGHLLTMTSGSGYRESDNPFGEHVILNYTADLESRILDFSMADEPGEVFRYKSGDNALLGLALSRALGPETITAYAQRRLWGPLGMQDGGVWTIDHAGDDGLEKTWCCLAASARDLAKLGRLYLREGAWNGQQLVPADWVQRSAQRAQVPGPLWPDDYRSMGWRNYGYQCWLGSDEELDYFALGKDGQFLYVNPASDLVIVRLGWSSGRLRSSQWIGLFQSIAGTLR